MPKEELDDYIKKSLELNVSKQDIKKNLLANGWNEELIDEAFTNLNVDENKEALSLGKSKRPLGVTILGYLAVILLFFRIPGLFTLFKIITSITFISSMIVIATVLVVVDIILTVFLAFGFLGLKKWLPKLVLFFLFLGILSFINEVIVNYGIYNDLMLVIKGDKFFEGIINIFVGVLIYRYVSMNKKYFIN